jgi:hypothetical protein
MTVSIERKNLSAGRQAQNIAQVARLIAGQRYCFGVCIECAGWRKESSPSHWNSQITAN